MKVKVYQEVPFEMEDIEIEESVPLKASRTKCPMNETIYVGEEHCVDCKFFDGFVKNKNSVKCKNVNLKD